MDSTDRKIEILEKATIGECKKCDKGFTKKGLCDCRKKFQTGVKLIVGGFPLDLIRIEKPIFDVKVLDWYISNPKEVSEDGLSLYVHGPLGVGKTLCSVWLAEEFTKAFGVEGVCGYKHDLSVQFMEASQFVLNERTLRDDELRKFHKTFEANLFVLDDWSNEYKSQSNPSYVDRLYERFFRSRISNCLPTIVTTNVPPQEVEGLYDEKIASLLGIKLKKKSEYDMAGRFVEVRLDGPDFRKLASDKGWSKYYERI